jgi:hypothetical protein
MVKLAARANARSSSRSMLRSSSRNGFSGDGALVDHRRGKNALTRLGAIDDRGFDQHRL